MNRAAALLTLTLLFSSPALADGLSPQDQGLLQRLVLAEAGGEGKLGMALVARTVLNRSALIQSGKVQPGTYLARSGSLRDVIYAPRQYEPVSNGSLDRRRSSAELTRASEAIALARNTQALRAALSAEGLSPARIDRLLSASGFRTTSAFNDPSQNYERARFGNHVFNGDSFSRRHDVPALFGARYERGAPPSQASTASGIVGALQGGADAESPPATSATPATYTVRQGDNLHTIAARQGTDVATLQELNPGAGSLLHPGQALRLPAPLPSPHDELYAEARGLEAAGQGELALEPLRKAVFASEFRDAQARYELARLYERLAAKTEDEAQAKDYRQLARGHLVGASEAKASDAPGNARYSQIAKDYLRQRGLNAAGQPLTSTEDAWRRGTRLGPIQVVTIDGKPVALETARAFQRMRAAAAVDGVQLRIVSGFRSYGEQEHLYRLYQQGRGNLAARPGYSNHQDGKALDLNSSAPGVLTWLNRNARRYGFLRTVPSEDWHWEYWPR